MKSRSSHASVEPLKQDRRSVRDCRERLLAAPLLLGALAACGGGDAGPINDEVRTLDSCETAVDDAAPAFYLELFRCVEITVDGDDVVIRSTSLPPHPSPYYPEGDPNHVEFDTMGNTRFKNPNEIAVQNLEIRVPGAPTLKGLTIDDALVDRMAGGGEEYGGDQGIAIDGIAMFSGFAAPGDDIDEERFTFDGYEGHPQMTGRYHYHGASPGPLEVVAAAGLGNVEIYGIMCDGTVVLGCTEVDGSAPAGTLDAQGGHVHDIGEYFTARYHTHVCPGTYADYAPEIQAHIEGDDCVGMP